MATGKALNLLARPIQSVDMCFSVDGIIGFQRDNLLGTVVQGFNIDALYADLSSTRDGGRLFFNAFQIGETLYPYRLSSLRAEPIKAALDKAIGMRENAYVTTYSPYALEQIRTTFYDNPMQPGTTIYSLMNGLSEALRVRHELVDDQYQLDGVTGVVTNVQSYTDSTAYVNPNGSVGGGVMQPPFKNTTQTNTSVNQYDYRHPRYDNDINYYRSQISCVRDKLAAFRIQEMCRVGVSTFENELSAMDGDIREVQSAYIDTILIPPFTGLVTGVFQNKGDFVHAGQPIMRIENDSEIYLVGTIKYRGLIRVGSTIKVETTLAEAAALPPIEFEGKVVAVRGHSSVNEQWDVLILCHNRDANGDPILPLNYNLDFDSTVLEVTAI